MFGMRQLRYTRPGAIYHITSRANRKEHLLASPVAKELFIEYLPKLRAKYDCSIVDFVVMENHVHLLFQPLGNTTLSECMKWLLGLYTMNYNRVFKTWGRVWGGRYYSRPIGGLGDLEKTIAYVDENPVRAFLASRADEWPWGGLWMHQRGSEAVLGPKPEWLSLIAPRHSRLVLGV
jgi:putative transposase